MVNLLIANKNTTELNLLWQKLANDKNYIVENATTGKGTLEMYLKTNPNILILDNSLPDMSVEDIINRLSTNPVEVKKCNIVLTLPLNYTVKINNYRKICEVIYKPFKCDYLKNVINEISIDYNIPDLEIGEIDWLLQSLNFNCLSRGYKYMKKAISYCYYRPDKLEYLNNVLKYLAYEFNTTDSQVRDSLNASIRPFNSSNKYTCPDDLINALYNYNNGYKLSLKDFLESIVIYLIKKKGRLF